jgi:soluble lytic murein transglycosylase-like protein
VRGRASSPAWGFALALLASLPCLAARPALADEAIARRLAALRVLVPEEAEAPLRARPGGDCAADAWWSASPYAVRSRTEAAIRDAALRFAVDERLIRSVIRHESNYDIRAVSHKGAMGLMQLMPATARQLGVHCAFDPRANVLGGTRYLRQLRDQLGSWARAIAGYNAGPARVESGQRLPRETEIYLERVLGSWR